MLCVCGWGGRHEREVQEGGDICILMAVSHIVQQKPTQHCKAIILHVKKREREREREQQKTPAKYRNFQNDKTVNVQ